MADNNLSKNIKIGIDVELNKRSVDEVTRQIAALSKDSIKMPGVAKPVNAQDFSQKLLESFFNSKSKVTTKQLIDLLPTRELKKAAGEIVDIFKDVKEQLRDAGMQLKYDKGSARYVTAPLGRTVPTKFDTYNGRKVASPDFDAFIKEVRQLRGQDRYTTLGSAARGNIKIEALRQLFIQEIEKIVGGSIGSGVKIAGLAQYMSPSQAGITRIEESEKGLVAVVNNIEDDLDGLDDATRNVISEMNKNAKNVASVLGIRVLQTRIDPRTTPKDSVEYGDLLDPSSLGSISEALKTGIIGGLKFNAQDFADFVPGKDGSIAISPALMEIAYQRALERMTPAGQAEGAQIAQSKVADALNRIAPILDKVNAQLFDQNVNDPNSGRIWGNPDTSAKPRSLDYSVAPYGSDSLRKLDKFFEQNPEQTKAFMQKVQDDILSRALELAIDAEAAAIEKIGGQDFSDDDIQHGMVYIADEIVNAIVDYEMQLGLNAGSIINSMMLGGGDAALREKLEASGLRGLLQKPYRDNITGAETSLLPGGLPQQENTIAYQVLSRPEFLKQAKVTTGVQDLMMQIMAMVPEQIAQATEPAVAAAVQQVEASDPFAAIFAKYEGLGLSTVIAKLRDLLAQSGGDSAKLLAGMDSEFANGLLTPITELSIKVQDEFGKVVDLLDFFHIPAGLDTTGKPIDTAVIDAMLERQGAGPQSTKDIAARAAQLGFDQSKLGSSGIAEGEAKANLELYQKKIKATLAIISLIDELGITLVGSNVVSADFSKLAQSADNLNKVAGEFGLEPTKITKDVQNIVDVYKVLEKLQKSSSSSPELQAILAKAVQGTGLKLAEIIAKIVENYPGALQGIEMDGSKVAKIGGLPPHFAAADATGSMAMHAFLRDLSPAYAGMASAPANWASEASYGHGASLMPYSKNTRHKYASAFGNIQPELTFDAGARAAAAESVAASSVVADAQEKQAVQTEQTSASIEEQTLRAIQATKVYKEYAKTVLVATEAVNKINNALKSGENLSRDEKAALLKERANLATQAYDAKTKIEKLKAEALNATTNEDYLEEISRGPYDTLATQQLTGGGSVVRNIDRGRVGAGFGGAGRPPGGDGYITERGGEFLGPDPKSSRDASEQIKRQLKDQVQAQKEAQIATKALVSTWVTGRYALYDVGNALQNVSQNLFRFTKSIFQFTNAYKDYESAFTSVDRAMQLLSDEVQGMQTMFVKLSETMPISFEQLTAIGTLGAQMGVTADGIKNFTEVVAKFSSVTGISVETTAQKFGRIAELANVDYAQFENLGSAIAYAGVNAVATEAEILSLTESIAAVSEQAGFAPEEIVGLSTAIASLGIAPEQARGVFTRVFADINRAVSKGGAELQNFAKVSGMSSSEFASTWADSDGGAARAFRAMLSGLKTTGNMTKAFDDLNITETREVNTLTRLAENLNVVDSSMQDANTAFEEGAFLGDSFEKTVDNLDSKIILFQNNFKSAMQSISQSAALGFGAMLDIGSNILKVFKNIAEDSVLGPIMNLVYGVSSAAGVLTGVGAIATKVLAQIYAFRAAMFNTANDPNIVNGFVDHIKALTGVGNSLVEDHSKLTAVNGAMGQLTTLTYKASDSFAMLAGNSAKAFSSILENQNVYLSTGEGLAGASGISNFQDLGAADRTSYARKEAQGVAQVVEARKKLLQVMEDQLPWDAANASKSASTLAAARAEQIYIYTTSEGIKAVDLDTQMKLKNATAAEIEASAELTAARANIANAQANRAGAAAINTQTRAQSMASKGAVGFMGTMSGLLGPISIAITAITLLVGIIETITTAIEEANTVHLFEDQGGTAALRESIYKDTQAWMQNGQAIATVESKVVSLRKETPAYKNALIAASKGQDTLGDSVKSTTKEIEYQTLAIGQNTKELLAKAIYENEELQGVFKNYPTLFSEMENAGVNVSQILEDMLNPNVSLDELFARINSIKKVGDESFGAYNAALEALKQAIADAKIAVDDALTQSKLVQAVRQALNIIDETDASAKSLGATVRTVIDYANDLSSVFERIQQINMERLSARDTIISGWRNIRDAAKSAQEAIKEANQEISDLSADRAMLQYQYDVAQRYGDERRMAILKAKLAKSDEDIAAAQQKRADAEDEASTSLVGSSKAAIKNRSTVNGMVDSYQNYVLALVRAGVKGKALEDAVKKQKQSFIDNAVAAGYSEDELGKYAKTFDDFLTAVKKTPRNVTIEFFAEMSAAENALREFLAKANSSKATVQLDASGEQGGQGGTVPARATVADIVKGLSSVGKISRSENALFGELLDPASSSRIKSIRQINSAKINTAKTDLVALQNANPRPSDWDESEKLREGELNLIIRTATQELAKWTGGGLDEQRRNAFAAMPEWVQAAFTKLKEMQTERKNLSQVVQDLRDSRDELATLKVLSPAETTRLSTIKTELGKAQGKLNAYDAKINTLETALNSRGYGAAARKLYAGYATGGYVSGGGSNVSDSIPAVLSNGEYVVRANAVKAVGLDTLDKINNADRFPAKFYTGGLVQKFSEGGEPKPKPIDWTRLDSWKAANQNRSNTKLTTGQMQTMIDYILRPLTLHLGTFESNRKDVDKAIIENKMTIAKGTNLVRVANDADKKALANFKPGQSFILDQFLSVTSGKDKAFIKGMLDGTKDTGGRYAGRSYPLIRFSLVGNAPGIYDMNTILPPHANENKKQGYSSVVDGLLARGQTAKLIKVGIDKEFGVPTYYIELGGKSKAKVGLMQNDYNQDRKAMLKDYLASSEPKNQSTLNWLREKFTLNPNLPRYVGQSTKGSDKGGSYGSSLPSYGWSGTTMQTRVGRADGGMIFGPGGPRDDKIPAMLSNGEYVINAKATSAYGADFMNALNQQRVTFAQPQSMSQNVNNGPTMVYLSPEDRALLRAAVERPVELYTENTKIAQSANAGNVILAQRGMR